MQMVIVFYHIFQNTILLISIYLFRCKIVPEVNEIEFNPYINDKDILDVCRDNGIIVQAYGPIGSGTKNTFVGGLPDGACPQGKYL